MISISNGPRYAKLAQDLIARIEQGRLQIGDKLPTEEELCQQHGVSRVTVRSALAELEHRGLVLRRPRLGTTVISNKTSAGFVHAGDNIQSILNFTRDLPFVLLEAKEITLTGAQATATKLSKGLRMLRVTGLRKQADRPAPIYSVHLIPVLLAPPYEQLDGLKQSIAQLVVERYGHEIHKIEQTIDVSRLDQAAARALESRAGTPALRTQRWYRLRGGELAVMSTGLSPEGRYSIVSNLQRESQG